jgi:hypothetical protein
MEREKLLRRRIRALTWVFIFGLVLSGATALPLKSELDVLVRITKPKQTVSDSGTSGPGWAIWLSKVHAALVSTGAVCPFLFYGTDWLAFGHFVIALAFIGALRDPLRNAWLFDFGLLACALVIPYALLAGAVRGIPFWWRLIDCSFGLFGAIPIWLCRRWTALLQRACRETTRHASATHSV